MESVRYRSPGGQMVKAVLNQSIQVPHDSKNVKRSENFQASIEHHIDLINVQLMEKRALNVMVRIIILVFVSQKIKM